LRADVLAPDVKAKLAEADCAGSPACAEVAAELHRLRDMQLGPEKSGTVIRAASNRVVERYRERREKGGRLSTELLNGIDVGDVPAKTFACEFAVALATQVDWAARDMRGERGDGLERDRRRQAEGSSRREGRPASPRQRDVEALRERGTWSVPGTLACNADLADICDDFPDVPVNRIRQVLVDKSSCAGKQLCLTEVLERTRQAIRDGLKKPTTGAGEA